jgi:hypothetical protein
MSFGVDATVLVVRVIMDLGFEVAFSGVPGSVQVSWGDVDGDFSDFVTVWWDGFGFSGCREYVGGRGDGRFVRLGSLDEPGFVAKLEVFLDVLKVVD